jgi:hypothetical protein
MTLESTQKKILEKILNSKEFSHSQIYQNYLLYLVEATSAGRTLKEITIGIEVLGKDSSFNPAEDTIVRSHTYTLRKKLESYYYNEGKEDKYRLRIPKGHYETKFVPVSEKGFRSYGTFLKIANRFLIPITLVLCALLVILWSHDKKIEKELAAFEVIPPEDPIWKEYLESNKMVLVIIGNHFFFNEYNVKYQEFIGMRHPRINSIEDMQTYQALNPDMKLEVTNEPYFPFHSIWSLPPILNLLYSVHKTPILRKSSDISPQILDEYNIIYLGSIKTLYRLKYTLLKSHFDFEISPHRVIYTPPNSEHPEIYETTLHSQGPNEDLVLALKLPGPDHNSIFIVASYHSLGAPEIANYLTNLTLRAPLDEMFIEQFGEIPSYFEILFRVTGIDKTAYDTQILVLDKIIPDESFTAN